MNAIRRIALVASVSALAGAAHAQSPPVVHLTGVYEGSLLVKLLDVRSDFILGPLDYRAGARAHSSGPVDFVHPFSVLAQSQGVIRGRAAAPVGFLVVGGRKRRSVDFRGKPAAFGADPLSQLVRISLNDPSPCVGSMIFFDGKQRYRMSFSPLGPGALTPAQKSLPLSAPTTCRLGFQPLSGLANRGGAPSTVLRGESTATFARSNLAKVWVLSRVEIGTILGPARIELTNFTASSSQGALVRRR